MTRARLSRREMCRLLAAGPAAFALGAGRFAAANSKPFALHYALASSMYGTLKLEDIVPEVSKMDAKVIDLWPLRHGDQREQMEAMGHEKLAKLLDQHDVKLGMTTRYDLGPFGLQDEMRVLKKFGGRLVIAGSRGPRDVSGEEAKKATKQFVEAMKPHVAVAEELGVTIGIENHAHALLSTPDSLRYFADFAESPNLGVALAPYHLPQDEGLLAGLIEDLGSSLVHFYAWQHGQGCMEKLPKAQELEQMPGRGTLDFKPLLTALAGIGYQGWTEIFMHPVPRGIPIMDTLEQVTAEINLARRYLTGCLRQIDA
ncbi:sugar phosphate isomerase/epimerase family protein [Planctomycetota bacterium]